MPQRAWEQLRWELERDLEEFNRLGGKAEAAQISDCEMRISDPRSGLLVRFKADLGASLVRYDFESTEERVAAPEGGILSLRVSDAGEPEFFSSDERIASESARRLLLQPILLDAESAA